VQTAGLPSRLSDCGISRGILPVLAEEAAQQWTGRCNSRPVSESDLLHLYEAAY
jgi:alcohol dehydrogenase